MEEVTVLEDHHLALGGAHLPWSKWLMPDLEELAEQEEPLCWALDMDDVIVGMSM